ncbi:MAG: T9SS type A sorting domain-containing protein [Hymenobacteraceae bacterium]|nr:T9SS type A sorting domain-containing protein [Hymenobacteraceae bacterium]MDX5512855.1 T9SS type A sorting domain-containing protein [Hymenobacteraceae bacterium]
MMKKLLFLGLIFSAGMGVSEAQTIGSYGDRIGKTWYDLQTNTSTANRLVRNSDGTLSASWTENCTNDPAFATRGAGYNYFDGTSWIHGPDGTCPDPYGIASKKVGWPEIMVLQSGKEVVISHTGSGLTMNSRPTKGTGGLAAWTPSTDLAFTTNITTVTMPDGSTKTVRGAAGTNGTWPRAVSTGNTIHLIYALSNGSTTDPAIVNGVTSPFVYSRSTDGGVTWDKQNVFMPGLDSTFISRIGGDAYAMNANGSNVAIVSGTFGEDWTLWKSNNNGTSFTKTIIKGDIIAADTLTLSTGDTAAWSNDNAFAVLVDNNGVAHAWAGQILIKTTGANPWLASTSYYPLAGEGILYWNERLGASSRPRPQLIAVLEDIFPAGDPKNFIGSGSYRNPAVRAPYGTKSMTSMPNSAVAPNGDLYTVYSGIVEGTSNNGSTNTDGGNEGQSYRDLYIMRGRQQANGDVLWSDPINIARRLETIPGDTLGTSFEEDVYPAVAHMIGSDNKIHLTWQLDYEPGITVNGDLDPATENAIMYWNRDVTTIPFVDATLVSSVKDEVAAYVNSINAYPNPTTGAATIQVNLKKASEVSVKIFNMMGQQVATVPAKQLAEGNNNISVDMSNLASGMYLYTVEAENFTVTNRIVKQ